MATSKLVVRSNTVDLKAKRIGYLFLVADLSYIFWLLLHEKEWSHNQTVFVGVLTLCLLFFQMVLTQDAYLSAQLHDVEEYRPYLQLVVIEEQLILKNIGRGIAFDVELELPNSGTTFEYIGTLKDGEQCVLSGRIVDSIKDHGLRAQCSCQTGRLWGANFSTEMEGLRVEYEEYVVRQDKQRIR